MKEDRFLAPGTRVRLDSFVNDNDYATSEFGVIVHCWLSDELNMFDCYVAFFGDEFPTGQPADKPYILKYAATVLVAIAE